MSFAGITFVVIGQFSPLNKKGVIEKLRGYGARVKSSFTMDADYVLVGAGMEYQARAATRAGMIVLPDELVKTLLDGMSREEFEAAVASLRPSTPPPTEQLQTNELVEELRPRLHGDDRISWSALVKVLDAASPEAEKVLTHYVSSAWRDLSIDYTKYGDTTGKIHTPEARDLPEQWKQDVLAGKDSSKYQLVTSVGFDRQGLGNKALMGLVACPSLCNVKLLHLSGNKPGVGFFKALANAEHFNSVRYLMLQNCKITDKMIDALLAGEGLQSVRHIDLLAHGSAHLSEKMLYLVRDRGVASLTVPPCEAMTADMIDILLDDKSLETLRYFSSPGLVVDIDHLIERIKEIGPASEGEEEIHLNLGDSPRHLPSKKIQDYLLDEESLAQHLDGTERVKLHTKRGYRGRLDPGQILTL